MGYVLLMGGLICLIGSLGLVGGGVGAGSGDIGFWLRLWNFTKKIEIDFGSIAGDIII